MPKLSLKIYIFLNLTAHEKIFYRTQIFWHGANWTFLFWGLINAIYFIPLMLSKSNRKHLDVVAKGRILPTLKDFLKMVFTFCMTMFAWIFFRSKNISHALEYINGIFSFSVFTVPTFPPMQTPALVLIILLIIFMIFEWIGREEEHTLAKIGLKWEPKYRYTLYYLIIFVIFWFWEKEQEFIYFQF